MNLLDICCSVGPRHICRLYCSVLCLNLYSVILAFTAGDRFLVGLSLCRGKWTIIDSRHNCNQGATNTSTCLVQCCAFWPVIGWRGKRRKKLFILFTWSQIALPVVGYKFRGSIFKSEEKPPRRCLLGKKGLKTPKHPYGISKITPYLWLSKIWKYNGKSVFLLF